MSPKAVFRGEIKKLLKSCSSAEFSSQGELVAVRLSSARVWALYKTIFLFLSTDFEIDTCPLLEAALKAGKKVFAPKTTEKGLVFFPVRSLDGPWHTGHYGIREPAGSSSGEEGAAMSNDFPALVIAPGIAFDRQGNRLGRGGGYYDRFFARLDQAGVEYTAIGLCMDFQLVEKIPARTHDKKMDSVLTGKELYEKSDFPIKNLHSKPPQ